MPWLEWYHPELGCNVRYNSDTGELVCPPAAVAALMSPTNQERRRREKADADALSNSNVRSEV